MRIAYLLHYNNSEENGVFKKVIAQSKTWIDLGNEVKIFMVSRSPQMVSKSHGKVNISVFKYQGLDRIKQWGNCVQEIINWNPDVVYLRQDLFYPALSKLVKNCSVVVEVNTDDVQEYQLTSFWRSKYNNLTRGYLLNRIDGFVFVSNELGERNSFKKFNKTSVVIGNGINLSSIPQLPAPDNKDPHFVFIGSGTLWHGANKLISLARKFPKWHFDFVGVHTRDMPKDLPQNVICHGFLERRKYEEIFRKSDVAVGTLALHVKNMEEASPLKVREYLSYGIPTIIGYRDTDFTEPTQFLCQLPNSENNVADNLEKIKCFVDSAMGKRVSREQIMHLDSYSKERIRLDFFQDLISRGE